MIQQTITQWIISNIMTQVYYTVDILVFSATQQVYYTVDILVFSATQQAYYKVDFYKIVLHWGSI